MTMRYKEWELFLIRREREFVFECIEGNFPWLMQPFLKEKWDKLKKEVINYVDEESSRH